MTYNFIEVQFPVDISYGSSGGPEYATNILNTTNGCEIRQIKLYNSKMKFNISTGIRNKQQVEQLISFFRCCKGRYTAFRFKDWTDFKGQSEAVKIINNNNLQLIKTYKLHDNTTEERIITKPVKNTVFIYIDKEKIDEAQLEIDYTKGRIILPPHIKITENTRITADFEFDVPVRFDIDYLPITIENYNFYSLTPIQLIEVLL
jgi:uncharacterized protein (TIGR02217 family)